jgi:hypothetical protein
MPNLNPLPVVRRAWRRRRLAQLVDQLQLWEIEGRDLLAQVVELTEHGDKLHRECARVLDLLASR